MNIDRFKFRCFDKKLHKMIDLQQESDGFILSEILANDDYILMQCTGLKDRNNVLIFEGDVINWSGSCDSTQDDTMLGSKKMVKKDFQHYLAILHEDIGLRAVSLRIRMVIDKNLTKESEILGNIYSNPELMKFLEE